MATEKRRALGLTIHPPTSHDILHYGLSCPEGNVYFNEEDLQIFSQAQSASHSDGQIMLADLEAIKVIGKGTSGIVQLVYHKWMRSLFALKIIQLNVEENVRRQILQELKINKSSQCPHVVNYYGGFFKDGTISIILEYMDGGSLQDVLKHVKVVPEPYLAVICKQVLQGLIYLHQRHIIHRDIKPSNLLVNHNGEVKITDFGVSAALSSSLGKRNTFTGTCAYMSPERISGKSYGYDSDIWSLGLTLLECAIGRFPYLSPGQEDFQYDFFDLMEVIVGQPAPFAPADQFSSEFCSIISACIHKEPKNRLSAAHLLQHPFLQKYEGMEINFSGFLPRMSPRVS